MTVKDLIESALRDLHDLPSGIGPEDVDENDTSPDDLVWHVGSLAARKLMKALEILEAS